MLLFVYCLGLYSSLKVVLGSFGIEPDTVHSLMLWYGVNDFGLEWIKDWIFTQDNWLFSLVPIHFLEFWLFGANPALLITTGWLLFVGSTVAAGFIARQLSAKLSFYLIPVILIFAGLYAHKSGLISYSTSHNITNLFGLLSTLALLKWCKLRRKHLLAIIIFLNTAGGLSDPWMLPSYTLPTGLVGIFMMLRGSSSQEKISGVILAVAMAVSALLVKSLMFGMLDFLPQMHFSVGDGETIKSNFFYLVNDLGRLLGILPDRYPNALLYNAISILSIVALYTAGIWFSIRYTANSLPQVFFYLSSFSIAGISLALLISSEPATAISARFLINILYLSTISIAVSLEHNWRAIPLGWKAASITIAILFMVSGFLSTYHLLLKPGFSIKTNKHQDLMEFLTQENLNYGYGPYWSTAANAVTALSSSTIKLRPIQFDKNSGMPIFSMRAETSKQWYTTKDIPPSQNTFFVIVTYDAEECIVPTTCRKGLIKKYGQPERHLYYKGYEIMVWKKPPIQEGKDQYIDARLNEKILFNTSHPMPEWEGWSTSEPGGTWSNGDKSSLKLSLSEIPDHDLILVINGQPFLTNKHRTQEISVTINNQFVSKIQYSLPSNDWTRKIRIPVELVAGDQGRLSIVLHYKHAVSPEDLGLNDDKRLLALNLSSVLLKPYNQTLRH